MGLVCSCMASTFLLVGEIFSTVFLAVGEVGAILIRGVFSLLVGLCDIMAACACCCQVPWSERPDRGGYTYTTLALRTTAPPSQRLADKPKFSGKSFAKLSRKTLFVMPSVKSKKNVSTTTPTINAEPAAAEAKASTESSVAPTDTVKEEKVAESTPAQGWFGGWFASSTTAPAATQPVTTATPAS